MKENAFFGEQKVLEIFTFTETEVVKISKATVQK